MNERRDEILAILAEGSKSVKELASLLYISEMTVRRAVKPLVAEGTVSHTRGRVSLNYGNEDIAYDIRRDLCGDEKVRLARLGAQYLSGGELVYIDDSTTCYNLIPHLTRCKPKCVVTNSLRLALELGRVGIATKIIGGDLNFFDKCVEGCDAVRFISGFNFDVAFLSAKGIDEKHVSDNHEGQATVRRTVIEHSKRSIFLIDKSKHGKSYPYIIVNTNEITVIS